MAFFRELPRTLTRKNEAVEHRTDQCGCSGQRHELCRVRILVAFLKGPHSVGTRLAWQFPETFHDSTHTPADTSPPLVGPIQEYLPP